MARGYLSMFLLPTVSLDRHIEGTQTLKSMFDKCQRMIDPLGSHVSNTSTEASNRKNQNVTYSLVANLMSEVFVCDYAVACIKTTVQVARAL